MDKFFFFPLGLILYRTHQLFYSRLHGALVFFYFIFLKQIFRHKDQIRGILIIFVAKSRRPEDLWMIQTELEKHIVEFFRLQTWNQNLVRHVLESLKDIMVGRLLRFVHVVIIIYFDDGSPLYFFFHK